MFRKLGFGFLLLATLVSAQLPAQRPARGVPQAFSAATRFEPVPEHLLGRTVTRARGVTLDASLFSQQSFKRLAADFQRGDYPLTDMAFFDNAQFRIRWTTVQPTSDGASLVWSGDVEGKNYSQAVLVFSDTLISANISTGDGRMYQIRSTDDGGRWVREIDQRQFPNEGPTPSPAELQGSPEMVADVPGLAAGALADDGSTIDVMVLYTPTVTLRSGGAAAAQQLVQLAIAETNTGYQNSGVTQRVRLVYSGETPYTESGSMADDLNHLTTPGDGYLDAAQRLRDTYNADLVSLWGDMNGEACGLAWLFTNPSVPQPDRAFSVVDYGCATGYYSFGHEMGHNMGATHAREDNTGAGAYSYSYGYKQTGANPFRTIMAYKCTTGNCDPRINYWSNPAVAYSSQPTGVTSTSANSAANYLTLNNTRNIIANYRTATPAGGGGAAVLESPHPYPNASDVTSTYTLPGAASINVVFDTRTGVENGYDFILISDGAGNQIVGSPFTGTSLAGRTITVPGATIKVRLVSDDSVADYGFRINSVTATGGATAQAKLVILSLTAPTTATIGINLTATRASVANQGSAAAGPFRLGYYYSRSRTVTTSDVFSGTACTFTNGLAVGASGTCSGEVTVPSTLGPGQWYLAVIADDLNTVSQSDRSGNMRVSDSGVITIAGGTPGELTRPVPGSVLTAATATFQWSSGTGVTGYTLTIGSSVGASDIYSRDQGTALSATVSGLPTNGAALYVRLTSRIGSTSPFRDYTIAAANIASGTNLPKLVVTTFTAPVTGQPGVVMSGMAVSVTNRSTVNAGAFRIGFYFSRTTSVTVAGSTASGWSCNYPEGLAANLTATCSGQIGVPATLASGTWYVAAIADDLRVLPQSDTSGNIRVSDNGPVAIQGDNPAGLVSPVAGSTFSSSTVNFRWDTGNGADQYYLSVGYTSGGRELAHNDQGLDISTTITEIPVDGRSIYVRLWTRFGDNWTFNDYTFRAFRAAAGSNTPHLAITSFSSPVSGTVGVNLQGTRMVITNSGSANAGAFRVGYYYSRNRNVTTSDIFSGWSCTLASGLAAGSSFSCSGDVGVPASLSAGTWYVAAIADDTGLVTQADRSDSMRLADTGPLTLTASGAMPESGHPYADNTDQSWTFTVPNSPAAIKVTFDSATYVEEDYDFIAIYDGNGVQIAGSPFTGSALAGKTVVVPGAAVRVRLVTDGSATYYGFRIVAVADAGALPKLVITSFTAPVNAQPGVNLANMRMALVNQGGAAAPPFRVGFYYSRSASVTRSDTFSGWYCEVRNGLAPGEAYACGGAVGVPPGLTPGNWYLAAIADDTFLVDQADRSGGVRTNDNGVIAVGSTVSLADVATQSDSGQNVSDVSQHQP